MSKSNRGKFARRDTIHSLALFYDVMLYGRKIKNEAEKDNVEASYFAMVLLLPREPFLEAVNNLGGIDECYAINNIRELSKMFNVEPKLVQIRLKDLDEILEYEQQIDSNKEQNYNESNIENVRKSIYSSQFLEVGKSMSDDSEESKIDTGEKTVDDKYDMGLSRPPRSKELLKGLSQIDDILSQMKEAPSDSSSIRDIFITIIYDLEKFLGQTADTLVIAAYIKKCFLSKTEEEYNNSVEEFKEDLETNNIGVDIYNYCMSIIDLYDEYFPKKDSIKQKRVRKKNNNNYKSN